MLAVTPILFVLCISEVHGIVEGKCDVASISFVDDVTWIAKGRSIAEVQGKLEQGAARAITWARHNIAAFEVAKTEAILFSRNWRHWKGKA